MLGLEGNYIFELLPNNQNINSYVYCRHLDELDVAIKQKWPELVNRKGVVLHHMQCQTTHKFGYSPETFEAWMGYPTPSTIFS